MVQGWADCLLQRDGPESQPALPVIITKTCTVDFSSSRPLLGVSWDLTCVRHNLPPPTFHHRYTPIRPPVKRRHCRAFDASLNAERAVRAPKRAGSVRKQNICSSAASCLKISPWAEGRGLYYGPTLPLWSILRMLLKAFVHPSPFVPAECCMLNSGNVFLITSGGHASARLASARADSTARRNVKGHCRIDCVIQH